MKFRLQMTSIVQLPCRLKCTVNREDLGTRLSCFGCENKNGGHFTRSKSKNYAKYKLKTWQEQQEDNSKGDICYLENICGAEQP